MENALSERRRFGQGAHEVRDSDIAMLGAEQTAGGIRVEFWFQDAQLVGIQPPGDRATAAGAQDARASIAFRNLDRPISAIFKGNRGRLTDRIHEVVVRGESAGGEIKKRAALMRFDVGSQDARGCVCGTGPGRPAFPHRDGRATACEFEGDRTPDDAAANYGNVLIPTHVPMISKAAR